MTTKFSHSKLDVDSIVCMSMEMWNQLISNWKVQKNWQMTLTNSSLIISEFQLHLNEVLFLLKQKQIAILYRL